MIRSLLLWSLALAACGTPLAAATYGNALGDERIQTIVSEVTRSTLPELGRDDRVVLVTKDFEQRIVRTLTSLEAGSSPEEDLRRGYRALLTAYARHQEAQPPPVLTSPAGPEGKVRLKIAAEDGRGAGIEVVEGSFSRQWYDQSQGSGKRLIVLQESGLAAYLKHVQCGEMPCQIPPCCGRCASCKDR